MLIDIQNIQKCYGPVVAVEDVNLSIEKGEFMTFLGPSGSGKSTTLYILAGLEDPTSGDIFVNGNSILKTPSNLRNIGMVFQRYTLFPHLSVGENIAFPLRVRKMSESVITERVRHVLQLTRLQGFEDRMPANMSGGQQQRVALARALAYNPEILLMDEPLSALDKKLKEEIQHEIRRIHQETGVTILYVTHDQEEALRLSDRISVFNHGKIEQTGTGEQLYYEPRSKFVAEFIGSSDFLSCDIQSINGDTASVKFANNLEFNSLPIHNTINASGTGQVLLRPERLDLSDKPQSNKICIPVKVEQFTFLGSTMDVITKTPWDENITVRLPYGHPFIPQLKNNMNAYVIGLKEQCHVFCNNS